MMLLPDGSLRVPGRLAKAGEDGDDAEVFVQAEELFAPAVMRSLSGAPVMIDDGCTFVGRVENVHRDGNYLAADLLIDESRAIRGIREGELRDLSLDFASWEVDYYPGGVILRCLRVDHVDLLPSGESDCALLTNVPARKGPLAAMASAFLAARRPVPRRDDHQKPR